MLLSKNIDSERAVKTNVLILLINLFSPKNKNISESVLKGIDKLLYM